MLILNDGTQVRGHILPDGEGLKIFVYLDGMSIAEGFTMFSYPGRTEKIISKNGEDETVYEDYTELWAINNEYGNCNITMKRGDANELGG